jgi:hypothetical protein
VQEGEGKDERERERAGCVKEALHAWILRA